MLPGSWEMLREQLPTGCVDSKTKASLAWLKERGPADLEDSAKRNWSREEEGSFTAKAKKYID
jgi:hypothetical protein